jgi:preprotein translocase subunit SecA
LADAEIFEGGVKEDFNLDRVIAVIKEDMGVDIPLEAIKDKEYDELAKTIYNILTSNYEQKMSVVDEEQRNEIERIISLQILDKAWREHLYQMDVLKTGIGLRGYNQKDPLIEYKKESYNLFVELVEQVKYDSLKTLHKLQLRSQEEAEEEAKLKEMMQKLEQEANEGIQLQHESSLEPQEPRQPIKAEKKIPRNAPCPCGSGKKYKNCCGKSGPKKGILAS